MATLEGNDYSQVVEECKRALNEEEEQEEQDEGSKPKKSKIRRKKKQIRHLFEYCMQMIEDKGPNVNQFDLADFMFWLSSQPNIVEHLEGWIMLKEATKNQESQLFKKVEQELNRMQIAWTSNL